jgi:hypothetical protein
MLGAFSEIATLAVFGPLWRWRCALADTWSAIRSRCPLASSCSNDSLDTVYRECFAGCWVYWCWTSLLSLSVLVREGRHEVCIFLFSRSNIWGADMILDD